MNRIDTRVRSIGAASLQSGERASLRDLEHASGDSEDVSGSLARLVAAQRCVAAQAEALENHLADRGQHGSRRVAREVAVVNRTQATALAAQLSKDGSLGPRREEVGK